MHLPRLLLTLAVCALGLAAAPAVASAWSIQSPSKNIICGDGAGGRVICTVLEGDWVPERACDGTWMGWTSVRRSGRARKQFGCPGGLPMDFDSDEVTTLKYGASVTHRGVTCRSSVRGMRCTNRSGHGFMIGRASARTF